MLSAERDVAARPSDVWRTVSDVARWAEVLPTMDAVDRVGEPGVVAVGSRFRVRQPGLATAVYTVTQWHAVGLHGRPAPRGSARSPLT